jgi:hypothetical protein
MQCSVGLGCNRFCVLSPCNFHTEDYIEILYTIYKRNISFIHCKKRLMCSNSMGEVDCPSLFFIDFMFLRLHQVAIGLSTR